MGEMELAKLVAFGVDLAIGLLIIEAMLLFWLASRGRIGLSGSSILLIAGAGLGLILALRGAVNGAHPAVIGSALGAAGLCHAFDLARRLGGKK